MPDTSKYTRQTVLSVHQWVPGKLFSLRTTRDPAFVFEAGQFARLGLPAAQVHGDAIAAPEPTIWRAYSMVSAPSEDFLEFYSIVVPDGEFSPRMAALAPGDAIYIDKTPFGFLTLARFAPDGDLWLLASGTGLSAFLAMLRDPLARERYKRVILVHGVRHAEELAYRDEIEALRQTWATEDNAAELIYLPIATREPIDGMPQARLTTLLETGELERLAGVALDPDRSKIMLCGNPALLADARKLMATRGFAPGRRGIPGNLAVENYW